MEKLENNDEVEFLFDPQKKKLTSPLLGSFLGKMAIAKIEKIKQLQKEKRAPLIKQRDSKKAERLLLRAELEKMAPITEEEEAEFNREYQELEELTAFIDEIEAVIYNPSLGNFIPGFIKAKLFVDYLEPDKPSQEDEKDNKPYFGKWAEKLDQEILEPARSRQDELRNKTDSYKLSSLILDDMNSQIDKLTNEITELRKEIKANREEEASKKDKIKKIFNSTTRKANQLDVLIRSVLSWKKADLRSIEGITQGEVLTVQGLRDIKNINKLITDIVDISAAGETLIDLFKSQEMVLDIIKDRNNELGEERSILESEKTTDELESPKKEEPSQDAQVQAKKTKAEIERLQKQIEIINQQQQKAGKRQEEEESRLNRLQEQIDKNSEKYFALMEKLDEAKKYYSAEELEKAKKEGPFNPFSVQIQQEPDLIDSQKR